MDVDVDIDATMFTSMSRSHNLDGIVVVESDHEVDAGARWHVDSRRRAAGTVVTLLRPESYPA